MLTAEELRGVNAMMPAFTTPDGDSIHSKNTVNVPELERGVDKIIRDGIGVITTTASSGECHTLLFDEFKTLAEATISTVGKRVPVINGCTSIHTREVLAKMEVAARLGADGVMVGVPHYYPSTVDNAVQFYFDIADAFPNLGILIYHNPLNHLVTIPVNAFRKLVTKPNIVGMKDSHRTPMAFMNLQEIIRGKISHFVNEKQLYPYMMMGAVGCWSIDAWMGPSPVLRAVDACLAQDWEKAQEICMAMAEGAEWDFFAAGNNVVGKLAMNEAGYVVAGPLRPPFRIVTDAIREKAKARAARWNALCQAYPLEEPKAVGV